MKIKSNGKKLMSYLNYLKWNWMKESGLLMLDMEIMVAAPNKVRFGSL